MKIKLDKHYQNVRGVKLAPGTHDVQADLAKYLVANGHAVYVETEDLPQAVAVAPDEDAVSDETVEPASGERFVSRRKRRK